MLKLVVVLAVFAVALGVPTNKKAPRLEGRIVGGDTTDIEHHPWQLALLYYLRHYCGATLFNVRWAITSAQCLEGAVVPNLAVRAGSSLKSSGGEIVDVRNTYIHPNYNIRTIDYDFALLELAQTVSVQNAAPIVLPPPNYPIFEGDIATITGWGRLTYDGSSPEILHEVQVPAVSHERCERAYSNYAVTSRMFCTGVIGSGGKDSCQGDAGGPVILFGNLVGIVSWGSDCASPIYPGVNAYVPSVVEWIHETSGV